MRSPAYDPLIVAGAFLTHCGEELPRFPEWATQHFGTTSRRFYIASHLVIVPSVIAIGVRSSRAEPGDGWHAAGVSIGSGLAANAIFHVVSTAAFRERSPGLVTALLGTLPAGLTTVLRARRVMRRRRWRRAVLTGVALNGLAVGSLWINMPTLERQK